MQETAFTGLYDKDLNKIHVGDEVNFLGMVGEVVFECGAYGIAFCDTIDWDFIGEQIPIITGCNNSLHACQNDNFISLWEIMWNFNCEENYCEVVEICEQKEAR